MQAKKVSTQSNVVTKQDSKDRLGSAVVSLIIGIFSILLLLLGPVGVIISGILSIVGLTLGLKAKNSSSGRGLAIAGITLTIIPLVIFVLVIIASIVLAIAGLSL
ncbi:hypothetical protein [Aquibacillus sediminis]|uniref:hypothetical protein n=1 Tax=Aquibacillus sediminis TaxID=2574734 RepID=UPI001108EFC6|nr:hypothetical protein [Aquibacillus sediminis]